MASLAELLCDLEAEHADLRGLVAPLVDDAPPWDAATPAEGWAVRDQISHLAFFDDAARSAMVEPREFERAAAALVSGTGDPMAEHLARGRETGGDELLRWWDRAHRGMMAALSEADPACRVPWYGPPMGVLSFVSARLMETWAHGQDVADALGATRVPSGRLRHVAHLGVRARPFSYAVRGLEVPPGRIDVDLVPPPGADAGQAWSWTVGQSEGDEPVEEVAGSALDFSLVVTQRRHVADTGLEVRGERAVEWMSLAQAFAGPPGPGRPARRRATSPPAGRR